MASQANAARKLLVIPSPRRERRRRKFNHRDLESIASREIAATESLLAGQMAAALARLFSDRLPEACGERRLLPSPILFDLEIAFFISHTAAAAKAANRITGVPAAVLIADALCFDAARKPRDTFVAKPGLLDFFDTCKKFATVGPSFLHRAASLASDRRFRPVLHAADRGLNYLPQLRRCERWNEYGRKERDVLIVCYGLQELDEPPRRSACRD